MCSPNTNHFTSHHREVVGDFESRRVYLWTLRPSGLPVNPTSRLVEGPMFDSRSYHFLYYLWLTFHRGKRESVSLQTSMKIDELPECWTQCGIKTKASTRERCLQRFSDFSGCSLQVFPQAPIDFRLRVFIYSLFVVLDTAASSSTYRIYIFSD